MNSLQSEWGFFNSLDKSYDKVFSELEEVTVLIEQMLKPWSAVESIPIHKKQFDRFADLVLEGSGDLTEDDLVDLLVIKKAMLREVGDAYWKIMAFVWSKKSIVAELGRSLIETRRHQSFITSLILMRTLLEHIGNCALMVRGIADAKTTKFEAQKPELIIMMAIGMVLPEIGPLWQTKINVESRFGGMRMDVTQYPLDGLSGRKRSYKAPKERDFLMTDLTARDLLKGIDLLDKRVKGTRNCYDFLCEFVHPNVAINMSRCNKIARLKPTGFNATWPLTEIKFRPGYYEMGQALYVRPVGDALDLVHKNLEYFVKLVRQLRSEAKEYRSSVQRFMKKTIASEPVYFFSDEYCPCLSRQDIIDCCGKKIKRKKFAKKYPV